MPIDSRSGKFGVPIWMKIGIRIAGIWFPIVIISAIAVPKLSSPRVSTEAMVIREIQAIHQAETQYLARFRKYATTLAELGPPANDSPDSQAADLIPASLASGEKYGYVFTLKATPSGYTINANPRVYNSTGRRTFFSNETMILRQNWSAEPASAASPALR